MVDDDKIGFLGGTARFNDVAILVGGTLRTQAIIHSGRNEWPDR